MTHRHTQTAELSEEQLAWIQAEAERICAESDAAFEAEAERICAESDAAFEAAMERGGGLEKMLDDIDRMYEQACDNLDAMMAAANLPERWTK